MASAAVTEKSAPPSARSHLSFIIAIAIAARIAMTIFYLHINPPRALTLSADEDVTIALSLLAHHGFASPFHFESGPTAFLAPGYPFLLAGLIAVMGTGESAVAGLISFQLVLSLITVILVTLTAQRYFGMRAGNLAGLICAIARPMLMTPLYIWETCLSALILLAAVAVAPRTRSRFHFAVAGLYCALATLVNPALLLALLAIFAWSAWRARIVPWIGVLCFLVAFAPWPIRNYKTMHAFIPFRSNFGFELWLGNRPESRGESNQFDRPTFREDEQRLFLVEGELGYMRQKEALAKSWIKTHRREFAWITVCRFARFWIGSSKPPGPITAPLVAAALTGLVLLWRSRQTFILFALPLLIYPLPYYITHADTRYQFVIDPLLAILAGYACEAFFAWCARRPAPVPTIEAPTRGA